MITVCCSCRRMCGAADERGYRESYGEVLSREEQDRASHGYCIRCFVRDYGELDAPDRPQQHAVQQ